MNPRSGGYILRKHCEAAPVSRPSRHQNAIVLGSGCVQAIEADGKPAAIEGHLFKCHNNKRANKHLQQKFNGSKCLLLLKSFQSNIFVSDCKRNLRKNSVRTCPSIIDSFCNNNNFSPGPIPTCHIPSITSHLLLPKFKKKLSYLVHCQWCITLQYRSLSYSQHLLPHEETVREKCTFTVSICEPSSDHTQITDHIQRWLQKKYEIRVHILT